MAVLLSLQGWLLIAFDEFGVMGICSVGEWPSAASEWASVSEWASAVWG